MAEAHVGYRRAAVGISAGLGVALPLAAYAATLPFEGINDAIRLDAMPFAAGIVAGVGMLTLTGHLMDVRAERARQEEEEAAAFASIFSDAGAVKAKTAGSHSVSRAASALEDSLNARAAKGVPVISRAVDALDEEEAWAEIDAMFSDDSPISCDPVHSKDMYQIALEELRRSEQAAAEQAARAAAEQAEQQAEVSARNEAMSALYGAAAVTGSWAGETGQVAQPVRPVATPSSTAMFMQAAQSAGIAMPTAAPAAAASAQPETFTTPMADYSGHEDMWAAALSILDEELTSAPAAASVSAAPAPVASETAYVPRSRMAAVAEGGSSTNVHSHVNDLVAEELARIPSKSVRNSTHEFLSVIDGGTASMPALQRAEA